MSKHKLLEENLLTSDLALVELANIFIRSNQDPEPILEFIETTIKIIPVSKEISIHAAKIKLKQRRQKPKFGIVDAIHYATAKKNNAVLVTTDADFSDLPQVKIIKLKY